MKGVFEADGVRQDGRSIIVIISIISLDIQVLSIYPTRIAAFYAGRINSNAAEVRSFHFFAAEFRFVCLG
jgi:hypothetical protein